MSKKKMRAFACAAATTLAFVPFLAGCTPDDTAGQMGGGETQDNATEQQQGTGGGVENTVEYGQVMGVNGDEVTVVLGELTDPADGSDGKAFAAGQDEVVFSVTDVEVTDENGAAMETPTLSADDVVIMKGTGSGADFKPESVQIVNLAQAAGEPSE